jgi:Domain of unknown function (DUF4169)
MGEVINLNKARKTRGLAQAKAEAANNRVLFGRGKAEKAAQEAARKAAARLLDGARRDDD